MFSAEQLALLAAVKTDSAERSWADAARKAVDGFQDDLFATRCAATKRNLASLDELGVDALTKGVVVSLCPIHHVFHLYDEVKALNEANNLAVSVQSRISTAEHEIPADEIKRLRGRVLYARDRYYQAVKADAAAMASYRRFGLVSPVAPKTVPVLVKSVAAVGNTPRHMPAGVHSPLAVRREQAQRVKAEIGITDSQLIRFYRCYRKKSYPTVAAAVNATLLVHDGFERMGVYLCGHCTNLHIGHRSNQGESLTPAFFTRAIAKWQAMPEVAARFLAEQHA